MDTFKKKYFLLLSGIIVFTIVFFLFNGKSKWLDNDEINLTITIIALVISIISLGLADQKTAKFNGNIKV